ncbi:hypothetical protein CEUSTIGMA_g5068.t1 [Chlamydomonas eustigma]|uniref:Uncharacterized protein n=1 Tax=Chlamydomonas eustigma TaxID=1157962 RepID=A0A250X3I2_9CHLO|nr:hypothetical protein CEUSTIGMA_g5068.t1 [Chlamydomonas eustigma]|eukprot:GAX77625.1 hypothetical protein CEUSTIGMA_g5068.t1 [Chlamydomonas eustigma]
MLSEFCRGELLGASQLVSLLIPSNRDLSFFICPCPGCNREDEHHLLSTHMIAEHFSLTKIFCAVLSRISSECTRRDACIVSDHHVKPMKSWQAHVEVEHLHHAWAITLRLVDYHSDLRYNSLPNHKTLRTATHQRIESMPLLLHSIYSAHGQNTASRTPCHSYHTSYATYPASAAVMSRAHTFAQSALHPASPLLHVKHRPVLPVPCPYRCGALPTNGLAMADHVLDQHLHMLISWIHRDPKAVQSATWAAVGMPTSGNQSADEAAVGMPTSRNQSADEAAVGMPTSGNQSADEAAVGMPTSGNQSADEAAVGMPTSGNQSADETAVVWRLGASPMTLPPSSPHAFKQLGDSSKPVLCSGRDVQPKHDPHTYRTSSPVTHGNRHSRVNLDVPAEYIIIRRSTGDTYSSPSYIPKKELTINPDLHSESLYLTEMHSPEDCLHNVNDRPSIPQRESEPIKEYQGHLGTIYQQQERARHNVHPFHDNGHVNTEGQHKPIETVWQSEGGGILGKQACVKIPWQDPRNPKVSQRVGVDLSWLRSRSPTSCADAGSRQYTSPSSENLCSVLAATGRHRSPGFLVSSPFPVNETVRSSPKMTGKHPASEGRAAPPSPLQHILSGKSHPGFQQASLQQLHNLSHDGRALNVMYCSNGALRVADDTTIGWPGTWPAGITALVSELERVGHALAKVRQEVGSLTKRMDMVMGEAGKGASTWPREGRRGASILKGTQDAESVCSDSRVSQEERAENDAATLGRQAQVLSASLKSLQQLQREVAAEIQRRAGVEVVLTPDAASTPSAVSGVAEAAEMESLDIALTAVTYTVNTLLLGQQQVQPLGLSLVHTRQQLDNSNPPSEKAGQPGLSQSSTSTPLFTHSSPVKDPHKMSTAPQSLSSHTATSATPAPTVYHASATPASKVNSDQSQLESCSYHLETDIKESLIVSGEPNTQISRYEGIASEEVQSYALKGRRYESGSGSGACVPESSNSSLLDTHGLSQELSPDAVISALPNTLNPKSLPLGTTSRYMSPETSSRASKTSSRQSLNMEELGLSTAGVLQPDVQTVPLLAVKDDDGIATAVKAPLEMRLPSSEDGLPLEMRLPSSEDGLPLEMRLPSSEDGLSPPDSLRGEHFGLKSRDAGEEGYLKDEVDDIKEGGTEPSAASAPSETSSNYDGSSSHAIGSSCHATGSSSHVWKDPSSHAAAPPAGPTHLPLSSGVDIGTGINRGVLEGTLDFGEPLPLPLSELAELHMAGQLGNSLQEPQYGPAAAAIQEPQHGPAAAAIQEPQYGPAAAAIQEPQYGPAAAAISVEHRDSKLHSSRVLTSIERSVSGLNASLPFIPAQASNTPQITLGDQSVTAHESMTLQQQQQQQQQATQHSSVRASNRNDDKGGVSGSGRTESGTLSPDPHLLGRLDDIMYEEDIQSGSSYGYGSSEGGAELLLEVGEVLHLTSQAGSAAGPAMSVRAVGRGEDDMGKDAGSVLGVEPSGYLHDAGSVLGVEPSSYVLASFSRHGSAEHGLLAVHVEEEESEYWGREVNSLHVEAHGALETNDEDYNTLDEKKGDEDHEYDRIGADHEDHEYDRIGADHEVMPHTSSGLPIRAHQDHEVMPHTSSGLPIRAHQDHEVMPHTSSGLPIRAHQDHEVMPHTSSGLPIRAHQDHEVMPHTSSGLPIRAHQDHEDSVNHRVADADDWDADADEASEVGSAREAASLGAWEEAFNTGAALSGATTGTGAVEVPHAGEVHKLSFWEEVEVAAKLDRIASKRTTDMTATSASLLKRRDSEFSAITSDVSVYRAQGLQEDAEEGSSYDDIDELLEEVMGRPLAATVPTSTNKVSAQRQGAVVSGVPTSTNKVSAQRQGAVVSGVPTSTNKVSAQRQGAVVSGVPTSLSVRVGQGSETGAVDHSLDEELGVGAAAAVGTKPSNMRATQPMPQSMGVNFDDDDEDDAVDFEAEDVIELMSSDRTVARVKEDMERPKTSFGRHAAASNSSAAAAVASDSTVTRMAAGRKGDTERPTISWYAAPATASAAARGDVVAEPWVGGYGGGLDKDYEMKESLHLSEGHPYSGSTTANDREVPAGLTLPTAAAAAAGRVWMIQEESEEEDELDIEELLEEVVLPSGAKWRGHQLDSDAALRWIPNRGVPEAGFMKSVASNRSSGFDTSAGRNTAGMNTSELRPSTSLANPEGRTSVVSEQGLGGPVQTLKSNTIDSRFLGSEQGDDDDYELQSDNEDDELLRAMLAELP